MCNFLLFFRIQYIRYNNRFSYILDLAFDRLYLPSPWENFATNINLSIYRATWPDGNIVIASEKLAYSSRGQIMYTDTRWRREGDGNGETN